MERYFIYYYKGEPRRIAKLVDNIGYAYIDGEWVKFPKIEEVLYEDIGYDEVSKEEAEKLIRGE